MKKFILSLTLILTVAFGAVLTLTRPAPLSARAETSETILENEDTSNYIENFLLPSEKLSGQWIRFYADSTTSLETTNLQFGYMTNLFHIFHKNGTLDGTGSIIKIVKPSYVDIYIPEDFKYRAKPYGGDTYSEYSIDDEEITNINRSTVRKLIKNENTIDLTDKSSWSEKSVSVGDKITGKWFRLYKQGLSDTALGNGVETTDFYITAYYAKWVFRHSSDSNSVLSTIYKNEKAQYVDFFIPEGTYAFFNDNYSNMDEQLITKSSSFVRELVAPVVEEPDEPTSEPEDESTSESLPGNESDVPGDESDESAIEDDSQKFIDKTTSWINDNLGLSLTSSFIGAVLLVLIISFFVNRAKK